MSLFGKKSAKVYQSIPQLILYSSIEQLQVALWTFMFIMLGFNNEKSLHTLPLLFPISYLVISNPSISKPSVLSNWSVWLLKQRIAQRSATKTDRTTGIWQTKDPRWIYDGYRNTVILCTVPCIPVWWNPGPELSLLVRLSIRLSSFGE